MSTELPDHLVRYLAAREAEHRERVTAMLAALTPRERALVREAAVMAFVRGEQTGWLHGREGAGPSERRIPKDSAIVADMLGACDAMGDLYPTIHSLARPEPDDSELHAELPDSAAGPGYVDL